MATKQTRRYHRKSKLFVALFLGVLAFGDFTGPVWSGETALAKQSLHSKQAKKQALLEQRVAVFISQKNRRISPKEKARLVKAILREAPGLSLPRHFRLAGRPVDKVALLTAFIHVESTFKRRAVSRSNARGYMQLKPSTVFWLDKKMGYPAGFRRLFHTSINLRKGVRYLNHLASLMPNLRYTVLAYNAGPGSVKQGRWNYRYWLDIRRSYLEFLSLKIPKKNTKLALRDASSHPGLLEKRN